MLVAWCDACRLRVLLASAVFDFAGAGFADADDGQQWQVGLEAVEDPLGEHFRGGHFEAWDVVEQVVVELIADGGDDLLDLAEVHEIALAFVHFAFENDVDLERVAMHSAALVALGETGQPVGRFKVDRFGQ